MQHWIRFDLAKNILSFQFMLNNQIYKNRKNLQTPFQEKSQLFLKGNEKDKFLLVILPVKFAF